MSRPFAAVRSVLLSAALAMAVGVGLAIVWVRSVREEGDAIGTLATVARAAGALRAAVTVRGDRLPLPDTSSDAHRVPDAREFVRQRVLEIRALLIEGAPFDRVIGSVDEMLDYGELARRTLGNPCPIAARSCTNHWDELTEEQQTTITELIRSLARRNVEKNLRKTLDFEFAFPWTAKDLGGGVWKVRTEAKSTLRPTDPRVDVVYVVASSHGRPTVIDVVTEGSSMTKNYYDQFHRMLTTPEQGYAYVVRKLEAKIARP